ncbi:ubiquinone/menaquinone biosynthesis methyltransferase [bacterium]|nr:ubiquinone/menaquinone biosynthesis methyltransferase [bacterium]
MRDMFSGIAGAYDLLNHVLSGGCDVLWRRRAVRRLPARPRARALDLCGGTGDFARALLSAGRAHSVVIADFALPMLARARRKLPHASVSFHAVDAHFLPYADQCFDAVLCAFGLRNVADLPRALAEVRRVLAPGGELLVLEFMGARRGPCYCLFSLYFQYVLPLVGRIISGNRDAYLYLPESVRRFHSRRDFSELLAQSGLRVTLQRDLQLGISTITLAEKA